MTTAPDLAPLLGPYLARQHWVQTVLGSYGRASIPTEITDIEILRTEHPGMASVVVTSGAATFHLVLGWRATAVAPGVLGPHSEAVLGTAADDDGDVLVYDFIADRELCLLLLESVTAGDERAAGARVVKSLVSHSSLVYDDRLFMKCYRVIEPRPRPEVEVLRRLDAVGFNHMLAPVAHWQRHGRDLALVREFVPGAVEGLALAQTSLRDLLARAGPNGSTQAFSDVGLAGGDLAPEMRRLGLTTGRMHLALAEAFGRRPAPGAAGSMIRTHGDYHLRRVMRADAGWLVAGVGDDPLMGENAGAASQAEARYASPLQDVADLCYSLKLAAADAIALQPVGSRPQAAGLAAGWEEHNVGALLRGYASVAGIEELTGSSSDEMATTLTGLVGRREHQG